MRRVDPDRTVSVLNAKWIVPKPDLTNGVWVTLDIQPEGAHLFIYDQAPDAEKREVLAAYPFPISEPVLVRGATQMEVSPPEQTKIAKKQPHFPEARRNPSHLSIPRLSQSILSHTHRLKRFFSETMYWRL
jgi:hypothetical protein